VVLPDLRSHGHSTGDYTTWGAKEKGDLKLIMDRLLAEKAVNENVYVFGIGLGACVGIQYAAIDPRCRGVLGVAPHSDFRSYARLQFGPFILNDADFQKVIEACAKTGDFNPDEASAVLAAKNVHCPLLLVHGMLDLSVPLNHSEAIFAAANEPKKLTVMSMELIIAGMLTEDWIADRVDKFIKEGLEAAARTQPSAQTRPAPK
jgi:hypothetical protein